MTLPIEIQFSQGSLQDYVDCPRRFQLHHVRRLRWPAVETEPALENERFLRQGAALHRLIRQHLTGVPVDALSRTVTNPELHSWWRNYLDSGLTGIPSPRYPEVMLSTLLGTHRLVARYDLIAVGANGRSYVVDWKTNRKRPSRARLSERLQTRVYPYLLVRAGSVFGEGRVARPDSVTMIYWFANFPSAPERFTYDADQYRADERYLNGLVEDIVEQITACPDGHLLARTEDQSCCRICRYRSLCRRGVEAGSLDETEPEVTLEEPFDLTLDFEQIAELEFG